MKLEYFRQIFLKRPHIPSFMEIRPGGAELFLADGRTNRHIDIITGVAELKAAFREFFELAKERIHYVFELG